MNNTITPPKKIRNKIKANQGVVIRTEEAIQINRAWIIIITIKETGWVMEPVKIESLNLVSSINKMIQEVVYLKY